MATTLGDRDFDDPDDDAELVDDDDFSYEEFVEREFGDSAMAADSSRWIWWTAVAVLAAMLIPFLMGIMS